jgi:hypothetical protein
MEGGHQRSLLTHARKQTDQDDQHPETYGEVHIGERRAADGRGTEESQVEEDQYQAELAVPRQVAVGREDAQAGKEDLGNDDSDEQPGRDGVEQAAAPTRDTLPVQGQRFPRFACSRSIASNSALKLPTPKPREPCRSMISKKKVGRSWTGRVKIWRR